jgi:hypothetical protein
MKLRLTMTACFLSEQRAAEYATLGFHFERTERAPDSPFVSTPMYYEPEPEDDPTIEFGSLDELMTFVRRWGRCVLFDDRIEIYNGYRE